MVRTTKQETLCSLFSIESHFWKAGTRGGRAKNGQSKVLSRTTALRTTSETKVLAEAPTQALGASSATRRKPRFRGGGRGRTGRTRHLATVLPCEVPVCRKIETRGTAMNVNLSPEIEKRVKDELAAGQYRDVNQFVETAVEYFLEQRQCSQQRLQALRRIGQAVDDAGLYERVLVPSQE